MKQAAQILFVLSGFCQTFAMDLITAAKPGGPLKKGVQEVPIAFFDQQRYLSNVDAATRKQLEDSLLLLKEGYLKEAVANLEGFNISGNKAALILSTKYRAIAALAQNDNARFEAALAQIRNVHDPEIHRMVAFSNQKNGLDNKNELAKAQSTYFIEDSCCRVNCSGDLAQGKVDFPKRLNFFNQKVSLKTELKKMASTPQKDWQTNVGLLILLKMNTNELSTIDLSEKEEKCFFQILKTISPSLLIEKKRFLICMLSKNQTTVPLIKKVCSSLLEQIQPTQKILSFNLINNLADDFFKEYSNYAELLSGLTKRDQPLATAKLLEKIKKSSIDRLQKDQKEKIKNVVVYLEKKNGGDAFSAHVLSQIYHSGWVGICPKDLSKAKFFAKKAMCDSLDAMEYYLNGQSNLFDESVQKELINSIVNDSAAPIDSSLNLAECLINKLNPSQLLMREEEIERIEKLIKKIEKKADKERVGQIKGKFGLYLYKNRNYSQAIACLAQAYEEYGNQKAGSDLAGLYSMHPEHIVDRTLKSKSAEIIERLLDAKNIECALSLGTLTIAHRIALSEAQQKKIEEILKNNFCDNPFEIAPILCSIDRSDNLRSFFIEKIPQIKNISRDEQSYLWGMVFLKENKWFVARQELADIKNPAFEPIKSLVLAQVELKLSLKPEKHGDVLKKNQGFSKWIASGGDGKWQRGELIKKSLIPECLGTLKDLSFSKGGDHIRNGAVQEYFSCVEALNQKLDILNQDNVLQSAAHFLSPLIQCRLSGITQDILKQACQKLKPLLLKSYFESDDKNQCLAGSASFEIEDKCTNGKPTVGDLTRWLQDFNSKADLILSSEKYMWIDKFRTDLILKIKKMLDSNDTKMKDEYFSILYKNASLSNRRSEIWSEFVLNYNNAPRISPKYLLMMKDALCKSFGKNDYDKLQLAEAYLDGKTWKIHYAKEVQDLKFVRDEAGAVKLLKELTNNGSEYYAAEASAKLGDYYYAQEEWQKARISYKTAMSHGAQRYGTHVGFCEWHLKNYSVAAAYLEEDLKKFIESTPNMIGLQFDPQMEKEYGQAITNNPPIIKAEAYLQLAEIYNNGKQLAKNETETLCSLQKFFFEFEKLSIEDYKKYATDIVIRYFGKHKLEAMLLREAQANKQALLCKYQYLLFGARSGIRSEDNSISTDAIRECVVSLVLDESASLNLVRIPGCITLLHQAFNQENHVAMSELFGILSLLVDDKTLDPYLQSTIETMSSWGATLIHHLWKEGKIETSEAKSLLRNVALCVKKSGKFLQVKPEIVAEVALLCPTDL